LGLERSSSDDRANVPLFVNHDRAPHPPPQLADAPGLRPVALADGRGVLAIERSVVLAELADGR
jgi:hypothetical protein